MRQKLKLTVNCNGNFFSDKLYQRESIINSDFDNLAAAH